MANARAAKKNADGETAVMDKPLYKKQTPPPEDKVFNFQLIQEFPHKWMPTDKRTGRALTPPYPHHYILPNSGVAYDEDYKDEDGNLSPRAREWRYIEGQPSIWVDEQPLLQGMEDKAIAKMLGDDRNELKFEYGQLNVRSIQKLKLKALQVQDAFEGKNIQYRPVLRTYKLNNPEKDVREEMTLIEKEYAAQKMAYECTVEHMIECAFIMGIPTDDQSESGLAKIKLEFIKRARYDRENPKALDWFTGILVNPITHVEYVFAQGLSQGILSTTQQMGRLTWSTPNQAIMDINPNGNVLSQLMERYNADDIQTVRLVAELEKQI